MLNSAGAGFLASLVINHKGTNLAASTDLNSLTVTLAQSNLSASYTEYKQPRSMLTGGLGLAAMSIVFEHFMESKANGYDTKPFYW